VIVKNLLDPSVFGYFRFSFRTEELAMKHYLIKITVLVLTLVLVSMLQEYSYASVAPLAMMVAYTLIYRPYKYVK
jgi:hypothetical protein